MLVFNVGGRLCVCGGGGSRRQLAPPVQSSASVRGRANLRRRRSGGAQEVYMSSVAHGCSTLPYWMSLIVFKILLVSEGAFVEAVVEDNDIVVVELSPDCCVKSVDGISITVPSRM